MIKKHSYLLQKQLKMLEEARCHTTTFFTKIVIIKPTNMCLSIVLLYYPGTS